MNDKFYNDKCVECIEKTFEYLRIIIPLCSWDEYDWNEHFKEKYLDYHEIHIMSDIY